MIERNLNAPLTSSLGRLFDAVAAVVLKRDKVDYEAQAAIELEGCAVGEDDVADCPEYALELSEGAEPGSPNLIRSDRMWKALLTDLRCGEDVSRIAARFHMGVAWGFVNAAANARIETGINTVALSGGCLHNRRLARLLRAALEEQGFQVFMHRSVSPGDGGLSYGQAVVAAAFLKKQTH
jgi:hydrogenase maturation protein HypF